VTNGMGGANAMGTRVGGVAVNGYGVIGKRVADAGRETEGARSIAKTDAALGVQKDLLAPSVRA
jgi:hypothetical protein